VHTIQTKYYSADVIFLVVSAEKVSTQEFPVLFTGVEALLIVEDGSKVNADERGTLLCSDVPTEFWT
jgi:hypothetical protein